MVLTLINMEFQQVFFLMGSRRSASVSLKSQWAVASCAPIQQCKDHNQRSKEWKPESGEVQWHTLDFAQYLDQFFAAGCHFCWFRNVKFCQFWWSILFVATDQTYATFKTTFSTVNPCDADSKVSALKLSSNLINLQKFLTMMQLQKHCSLRMLNTIFPAIRRIIHQCFLTMCGVLSS